MKKFIICIILVGIFSSCDKSEDPQLMYPDYILAGEIYLHHYEGIFYRETAPGWILLDNQANIPGYEDEYLLDINNDKIKDYKFELKHGKTSSFETITITLEPLNNNGLVSESTNPSLLMPLSERDTINASNHWTTQKCMIHKVYYSPTDTIKEGLFLMPGQRHECIGVKTVINDINLYGWIRISKTWGDGIWIFDHASTVGY